MFIKKNKEFLAVCYRCFLLVRKSNALGFDFLSSVYSLRSSTRFENVSVCLACRHTLSHAYLCADWFWQHLDLDAQVTLCVFFQSKDSRTHSQKLDSLFERTGNLAVSVGDALIPPFASRSGRAASVRVGTERSGVIG